MDKTKICCFTVNYIHSAIIVNNFIKKESKNSKIVYINEKKDTLKIKKIISRFYIETINNVYFYDKFNKNTILDYNYENFIFVINGKEEFIDKINSDINLTEFKGYIINCYDVFDTKMKVDEITKKHDYYINTTGVIMNDNLNNNLTNIK